MCCISVVFASAAFIQCSFQWPFEGQLIMLFEMVGAFTILVIFRLDTARTRNHAVDGLVGGKNTSHGSVKSVGKSYISVCLPSLYVLKA